MNIPTSFRFSSTKSFQLFTQGLQSLQSYERSPNVQALAEAEGRFGECVRNFPKDVLPHFYYGIVNTLRGPDGLDEAIKQFNFVLASKVEDLIPDAKYNLAIAHLEKYNEQDSAVAMDLLRQTRDEVASRQKKLEPKDQRLETIRLQALILEAYLFVEDEVKPKPSEAVFQEAERRLNFFWGEYEKATILESIRADLLADYYNTFGYYWNQRARYSEGDERHDFGQKALADYENALQQKKDWIPAKSNLASLYDEVLGDRENAKRLCEELLEIRPTDSYTRYLLGIMYEKDGATLQAISSYKKAGPYIPEANLNLGLLYEKLKAYDNAVTYLERVVNNDKARESKRDKAKEALARIAKSRQTDSDESATPA
jgi:hypothetical protein